MIDRRAVLKAAGDVLNDEDFWRSMGLLMAFRLGGVSRRVMLQALRASASSGVIFNMDGVHAEALRQTRYTSSIWWGAMERTTRDGLRAALLVWQQSGLGRRGLPDLIDALQPLFSPERAQRIAETEVTRIFAEGNILAARDDVTVGGHVWQTANDEKVCSICGPRHGHIWPKDSVPAIPAHVRCRCALAPATWEYIRDHLDLWEGSADNIPTMEQILDMVVAGVG